MYIYKSLNEYYATISTSSIMNKITIEERITHELSNPTYNMTDCRFYDVIPRTISGSTQIARYPIFNGLVVRQIISIDLACRDDRRIIAQCHVDMRLTLDVLNYQHITRVTGYIISSFTIHKHSLQFKNEDGLI